MTKSALILVVAVLAACGGSEDKNPVEGSWAAVLGDGCGVVFKVEGSKYFSGIFCTTGSTRLDLEQDNGNITVTDTTLTTSTTEATCADAVKAPETVSYTITGKSLTIKYPEGAITFAKVEAKEPANGAVATNGCFDEDGAFTASPLKPL